MANNTDNQIVAAVTAAALVAGIIYARHKNKSPLGTLGIAVLFGFSGFVLSSFLENEN